VSKSILAALAAIFSFCALLLLYTVKADESSQADTASSYPVVWFDEPAIPFNEEYKISSSKEFYQLLSADWVNVFDLHSSASSSDKMKVNTCNLFFEAQTKDMRLERPSDYAIYKGTGIACCAIKVISMGKPSKQSYVRDFQLDGQAPSFLPPQLGFFTSVSREEAVLNDPNIKSWADVDEIKGVKQVSKNSAEYSLDDDGTLKCEIVALGDFNNDQMEDVLLKTKGWVEGGSYISIQLFILTRKGAGEKLTLLKTFQVSG